MNEEYQQTVNLNKKIVPKKKVVKKKPQIDNIYDDNIEELQKIKRPTYKKANEGVFRKFTLVLAFILLVFLAYSLFFKKDGVVVDEKSMDWYSITLNNGDVYYGQVRDKTANPVTIENVYYDYDQINGDKKDTKNLRLVKRGQETHGPDGTMDVYQSNIKYLEHLSDDSMVLQAILEYEK